MIGWPKKPCIPLSTSLRAETPLVKSCCDDGATITGRLLPHFDNFCILKQTHIHAVSKTYIPAQRQRSFSAVIENSGLGNMAFSLP